MSSFTVNFTANAVGDHTVGWRSFREDVEGTPQPFWNTAIVNVITPGAQAYNIPVIENMYCTDQDLRYHGWVIAHCENPPLTDTSGDGIPDGALTWVVDLVQQTDPCIKHSIECENVPVASFNLTGPGSAYSSAPTIGITSGGGAGAAATAVLGDGVITSFVGFTAGSADYGTNSGTQSVSLIKAGQVASAGSGATADVTFSPAGTITNIVLTAGGTLYDTVDDASPMTVDLSTLSDATPPTTEATIDIACSGSFIDEVDSITFGAAGTGYTSVPTVGFSGGGGSGATATAVLETECPSIDLSDPKCALESVIGSGDPNYEIPFGDIVYLCADSGYDFAANYGSQYEVIATTNCHCEECEKVTITTTAASGAGKVTYQNCWDGTDDLGDAIKIISVDIPFGSSVELNCIIVDTLVTDDDSLSGGTIQISSPVACS